MNQGKTYQEDGNLKQVIKIIFYFSDQGLEIVNRVLKEINKSVDNKEIFLIDCRKKNLPLTKNKNYERPR